MSYYPYFQYMDPMMAMGVFNQPLNFRLMPCVSPAPGIVSMLNLTPGVPLVRTSETITVDDSESENENEEDDVDERSLYCGNLSEKVSEELLYEVFLQAGPLEKVHIPKDNNGKQRAYGFITYKYCSSVPYALKLYHGLALYGKRLNINFQGKNKFIR